MLSFSTNQQINHQLFLSGLLYLKKKIILAVIGCQELFEDGLANGEEPSAAEEAAALAAKEAKVGSVKFGWVKGVLVSVMFTEER